MKMPTGVEIHRNKIRIVFMYENKRCRESLLIEPTPKNIKLASTMRQAILYEIKTNQFDYGKHFPNSSNAVDSISSNNSNITIEELFQKWIELKSVEVSAATLSRYKSGMKTVTIILNPKLKIKSITAEKLLQLRQKLLTGMAFTGRGHIKQQQGRSVPTVNNFMTILKMCMEFAFQNGYIDSNPFSSIKQLRKTRKKPEPLSKDEFSRMITHFNSEQMANLWTLAVYTGMRHGELCALAWEDVDLVNGTITVRRNVTGEHNFVLPKTPAGENRVIKLLNPAIEVLKNQKAWTYMLQPNKVKVNLRGYGQFREDICSFVFVPRNAGKEHHNSYYSVHSIGQTWYTALKRAGVTQRKPYQSRHTYACWMLSAGANPSFLAGQMGHASAQMIYDVYGDWMNENDTAQIEMLNGRVSTFAPTMPPLLNKTK